MGRTNKTIVLILGLLVLVGVAAIGVWLFVLPADDGSRRGDGPVAGAPDNDQSDFDERESDGGESGPISAEPTVDEQDPADEPDAAGHDSADETPEPAGDGAMETDVADADEESDTPTEPGWILVGQVVSETGIGIADVGLVVERSMASMGGHGIFLEMAAVQPVTITGRSVQGRSDESGRFRIEIPRREPAFVAPGGETFEPQPTNSVRVGATAQAPYAPAWSDYKSIPVGNEIDPADDSTRTINIGTIQLTPAATLTGRVTDADTGLPIAGAEVVMAGMLTVDFETSSFSIGIQEDGSSPRTTTNDDGYYRLEGLPGRSIPLTFRADGYRPHEPDPNRTLQPGATTQLDVSLSPLSDMTVVVVDEAGDPIEGAAVFLRQSMGGTPEPDGVSNAAGEVILSPRELRDHSAIYVRKEGYEMAERDVSVPLPASVRIQLRAGGDLTFRLVDESGEPIALQRPYEIDVLMEGIETWDQRYDAEAIAEEPGRVRFYGLPIGAGGTLRIEHVGYLLKEARFDIVAGQSTDLGDITLTSGFTWEIHVTNRAGDPIAGATVDVSTTLRSGNGTSSRMRTAGQTGSDGILAITDFAIGSEMSAQVAATGYATQRIPMPVVPPAEGSVHRLEVVLGEGATIHVSVVPPPNVDDPPAALGWHVRLAYDGRSEPFEQPHSLDAQRRVTLEQVRAGLVTITLQHHRGPGYARTLQVEDGGEYRVTLEGTDEPTFTARLVNAAGDPVPNHSVRVQLTFADDEPEQTLTRSTDAAGLLRLQTDAATIILSAAAIGAADPSGDDRSWTLERSQHAGRVRTLVVPDASAPTATLRINVIGALAPGVSAYFSLTDADYQSDIRLRRTVALHEVSQWPIELTGLPAIQARWEIAGEQIANATGYVELVAGETAEVRIDLRPATFVRLQLPPPTDPDEVSVVLELVPMEPGQSLDEALAAATPERTQRFRVTEAESNRQLPAGRFAVRVREARGYPATTNWPTRIIDIPVTTGDGDPFLITIQPG